MYGPNGYASKFYCHIFPIKIALLYMEHLYHLNDGDHKQPTPLNAKEIINKLKKNAQKYWKNGSNYQQHHMVKWIRLQLKNYVQRKKFKNQFINILMKSIEQCNNKFATYCLYCPSPFCYQTSLASTASGTIMPSQFIKHLKDKHNLKEAASNNDTKFPEKPNPNKCTQDWLLEFEKKKTTNWMPKKFLLLVFNHQKDLVYEMRFLDKDPNTAILEQILDKNILISNNPWKSSFDEVQAESAKNSLYI